MYKLPQTAGDWTWRQILTYFKLCRHVPPGCVGEAVRNILDRECLPVGDNTDPAIELIGLWRRDSVSREELVDEALRVRRLRGDLIF